MWRMTWQALSVRPYPAGILDCNKAGSASCTFKEMTLDMDFVNDRLEVYSDFDPGPNATEAINAFYVYPGDNFGSSRSSSAALRSTFTFALPLHGYLNSQDRPQAGSLLGRSTRPTLNLLLLLRASV